MKGKPLKLAILTAFELIAKAVTGATALIVAEAKECASMPARRIALAWATGTPDFADMRAAAAKFPETAFFASENHAAERRCGTNYLQNDPRSRIQWSIRAIPFDLVRCFSRYEDATELTGPAVERAEPQSEALPEVWKPISKRIQPSPVNVTPMPPAITLHPIHELIVDRKRAWMGNCAAPESAFVTDGRILVLKSACDLRVANSKTVRVGAYGPESPVKEDHLKKIFEDAVKNATVDAEIRGYARGKDVGCSGDENLACITTRGGDIVIVDADKLKFVLQKTGADEVRVATANPEKRPIVLSKNGHAVAVMITCCIATAIAEFKRAEHGRLG